MLKILSNLKDQWYLVLLVILLLIVQANCDLALPDYTSKIIDTGIQNHGIEHGVPELIRTEEHEKVAVFLNEDEKDIWNQIYRDTSDDKILELAIKDDKEAWSQADEQFKMAIILNYNMSRLKEADLMNNEMASNMAALENLIVRYESNEKNEDGEDITVSYVDIRPAIKFLNESGMLPEGTIEDMKSTMQEQMEAIGDTMLDSITIAYAMNEYQMAGGNLEAVQMGYLFKAGAIMLGVTLIMVATAIITGFLSAQIGGRVGMKLRAQIFEKVVSFTNAEMDQFSTASLITRSTNDIQQVQMVTTIMLRMLIYAPILGIGGVIHVIQTGAGMEWIIIAAVAWIIVLVGILMIIALPKFFMMQEKIDGMNLVSREILTGLLVIRAFVREKTEEERFDKANKDLMSTMLFTNRVMTFLMPLLMMTMNIISVTIVWIGAKRIDAGTMQVGAMTAFITYTMLIVMSFLIICMFSIMLPRAGVAANRINEVLKSKVSVCDSEHAIILKKDECKGVIEFENVDFKYPGAEENVLDNISFIAKPGETTAIIGSTGCGKSTLINLIPRFYDVTNGKITIDGKDIREVTQDSLREQIGFVPQKAVLFSGTIASNISYGKEDASDEEIRNAAAIAQSTDFIEDKTDKYDSSIAQGGSNVSGGQKQRLSIARAVAKNPRIYIFDDSFSALDFKTDKVLREALNKTAKDSTVIIVAQRINTILNANQIIVLDDGKIVGIGSHEELLKSCEVYQQIAKSQLSETELQAAVRKGDE